MVVTNNIKSNNIINNMNNTITSNNCDMNGKNLGCNKIQKFDDSKKYDSKRYNVKKYSYNKVIIKQNND